MQARLLKEFRIVGPILAGGMVLTLCSIAFPDPLALTIATWVFSLTCAVLGVAPMGAELLHGTLLHSLSLPTPRARIWGEKLAIQTAALATLSLFQYAVTGADFANLWDHRDFQKLLSMSVIAPFAALGAGSFLVLFTRSLPGAFLVQLFATFLLLTTLGGHSQLALLLIGLCAFSGLLMSRHLYLNFQNYSSLGNHISFTFTKGSPGSFAPKGYAGVIPSLICKELGLQQVNIIIAMSGIVIAGVAVIARFTILAVEFGAARISWSDGVTGFAIAAADFVLFVTPVMVGSACVVEERRNGTLLWQATLPPARSLQWFIKLVIAVSIPLILGWPALLALGKHALPPSDYKFVTGEGFCMYPIYVVVTTLTSALVSSTARDYLQALTMGVLAIIILFAYSVGSFFTVGFIGTAYPVWLLLLTATPLVVAYSIRKGLENITSISTPSRLLKSTAGGLILRLSVALLVTAAVFHRTWEWFESHPIGQPKQFDSAKMNSFLGDFGTGVGLDPQGRLWRITPLASHTIPGFSQIGDESD